MTDVPATIKSCFIDLSTTVRAIEYRLGYLLKPNEVGLYLPHMNTPVITPDGQYYKSTAFVDGKQLIALKQNGLLTNKPDDIFRVLSIDNWNRANGVFDERNIALLVPTQAVSLLSLTPYVPLRSLKLIERVAQIITSNHFAFTKDKRTNLHAALDEALLPELRQRHNDDDPVYDEIDMVFEQCIDELMGQLRMFMRKDHYAMHSVTLRGDVLQIEKSIDYRIHVFNRKYENGEWSL